MRASDDEKKNQSETRMHLKVSHGSNNLALNFFLYIFISAAAPFAWSSRMTIYSNCSNDPSRMNKDFFFLFHLVFARSWSPRTRKCTHKLMKPLLTYAMWMLFCILLSFHSLWDDEEKKRRKICDDCKVISAFFSLSRESRRYSINFITLFALCTSEYFLLE